MSFSLPETTSLIGVWRIPTTPGIRKPDRLPSTVISMGFRIGPSKVSTVPASASQGIPLDHLEPEHELAGPVIGHPAELTVTPVTAVTTLDVMDLHPERHLFWVAVWGGREASPERRPILTGSVEKNAQP